MKLKDKEHAHRFVQINPIRMSQAQVSRNGIVVKNLNSLHKDLGSNLIIVNIPKTRRPQAQK